VRSVRKIEKKHKEDEVLSTPRFSSNLCPKLDSVDQFDRVLLRKTVMGFYKNNKAPFLKDVYHAFLNSLNQCEHVIEPENYEDANTTPTLTPEEPVTTEAPPAPVNEVASETPRRDTPTVVQPSSYKYATGMRVGGSTSSKSIPATHKKEIRLMSLETFRKLLHRIGFMYGRINKRLAIVQRPDVVNRRGEYLKRLRENENSPNPKPLLYSDETWGDAHARFEKAWVPCEIQRYSEYQDFCYKKNKSGRAPRIIIIGAGQF
jgi:hypothetical protein